MVGLASVSSRSKQRDGMLGLDERMNGFDLFEMILCGRV